MQLTAFTIHQLLTSGAFLSTTDIAVACTSPAMICLLWAGRRLTRGMRLLLAMLIIIAVCISLLLLPLTAPERMNGAVVLFSCMFCIAIDLLRIQGRATALSTGESEDGSLTMAWTPPDSSPDETTRVIDEGMVLNLENLAPEIDAISAEEFARRAERVGVFSPEQVATLENLIDGQQHLSRALTQAVSEKCLTVYQALHLLWGKEDRLRVGPYAVMNVLGVGGMSVVYRAKKLSGGSEIALKVVPKATRHESRFRREMQLAQLLAHPNIVVAYDVGETVDRYFIAMELVTGRNLQDVVRLHGNLSEAVALQYVLQAARGLAHAHERGVIHRDVKPGNLLLCRDGTVKVADLGLSQEAGNTDRGDRKSGAVSGTVDFMAPEQASPRTKSVPQIDVYGLGTTLYFLLTGRPHVAGESTSEKLLNLTLKRKFNKLKPGSMTARTMNLLRQMTAWESADRYAGMPEVIEAIESILEQMGRKHAATSVRVLVVEDDPAQMFLTVRLLSRTNSSIAVVKAHRLELAIDLYAANSASEEPVDLVLLDLNLPDSSGMDSLLQFKTVHPDAAVIVLSGNESEKLASDCTAAGAAGYICKSDLSLGTLERTLFAIQSEVRNQAILATTT